MTARELEEYRALRATIQARGTARSWAFLAGMATWAFAALFTLLVSLSLATVVPLLVIAATFEVVFALHVGVERIGRYLQVFHDDGWERQAMAFGPPLAGTGSDPLFAVIFAFATVCNFVPVLLAEPVRSEIAVLGGAHFLFLVRIVVARQAARKQRAADVERFRAMKAADTGRPMPNQD
jgi:hypothetical protein